MPQDHNSTIPWSQDMHQGQLGSNEADEDFTRFLDLENGYEQFQHVDGLPGQSSLETPMGRLAFGHGDLSQLASQNQEIMQSMNMSQFQPYQMYQQMDQPLHYRVPPTPVSAEMHAAKYSGQVDGTGYVAFDRHQNSFTPLVSPAQTPLDNAYGMPDYVMADDFFSPLTSPAIEAQPSFVPTNATASPIDLNGDHVTVNPPVTAIRKRARKANPSQPKPPRSVRQSPAVKPQQKRRQFSLNGASHERLESMLEKANQDNKHQTDPNRATAVFPSSEDSVSPEPLSEVLMRPPPVPSNLGRSPSALQPMSSAENLPATPAMIMRMPIKQSSTTSQLDDQNDGQDVMEDIALPDAVASISSKEFLQIDTKDLDADDQNTPTLSAKTPKLNAHSTPRTTAMSTQSLSSETLDKTKRPEARLGGRGNKKRPSSSSAMISPALRPKISPSISPLVPVTGHGMSGLSAETSALYLASKSNYQNILDGTHLPGVTYPETLAENLSSKRTSHKIAEQGRRNRINLALKEIESLLPESIMAGVKKEKGNSAAKDSEDGSPGNSKSGSSGQGTSKASTVEMAIIYIKSLQAELKETREKLEVAEQKVAEKDSSGSQSSG